LAEWFTTFFDSLVNDFWDAAMPPEATAAGFGSSRLLVVARRPLRSGHAGRPLRSGHAGRP
jgi:hypothetical protein